jgi:uncharacterized membrane protein
LASREVYVSESNRVFDLLRGFRAAAYRLQLWLALLGMLALAAAAVGFALGATGAWALVVGAGLLVASVLWALVWRRRAERAFWQGARLPRRGAPVGLPLE